MECPNCGYVLDILLGNRKTKCEYCGTALENRISTSGQADIQAQDRMLNLPWRLFGIKDHLVCRTCKQFADDHFIIARSKEWAIGNIGERGGRCAFCAADSLTSPRYRISIPKQRIPQKHGLMPPPAFELRGLFAFKDKKTQKCNCGTQHSVFYVVAMSSEEASHYRKNMAYAKCGLCLCKDIEQNGYHIETGAQL